MRANLWLVRGDNLTRAELDRATREALRNSARSIFDLYRDLDDPKAAGQLIVLGGRRRQAEDIWQNHR